MSDKAWRSATPQTILNCFINTGFTERLLNYYYSDDKWNFNADHLNLEDRIVSHYVEMDNNLHVFGPRTDNEILSETIENTSESKDKLQNEEEVTFEVFNKLNMS